MSEVQDFGQNVGDFMRGVFADSGAGDDAVFQRDAGAEGEVRGFLADLQALYARGDVDAIVNTLADNFSTYELIAANGRPVTIRDKARMGEYLRTLFPSGGQTQIKSITANRVVANSTLGLINEEGDVVISRPDGTKEHQPLRSSALAAKTAAGWKWTHWHMSEAGPRFRVNASSQPIDANGNVIPGARVVTEDGISRVVIDGQGNSAPVQRD
ncbi:nuclear transport factor 2 family protein [Actinokineospora sp.]|uniref:nuclear transport factor 2 family protein n=1 Tax=Actinokineospora sp. TaxID=1872133 RepID=UPI004037AA77